MMGDFEVAENAIANLIELATRVNAPFWMTAGQLLRGKLLVERREFAEGLAVLRDPCEVCRQTRVASVLSRVQRQVCLPSR